MPQHLVDTDEETQDLDTAVPDEEYDPFALDRSPVSDILSRLYADWRGLMVGGRLPPRDAIDPVEFTYALGRLSMVEVHRAPLRFRFRLNGTVIVDRQGFDLTGKWLSDHPEPENRALTAGSYTMVVETGRPLVTDRSRTMDGRFHDYEALLLPLSRDGETVDAILSAVHHRGL